MPDRKDGLLGVQEYLETAPAGIFLVFPPDETKEEDTVGAEASPRKKKDQPHLTVRTGLVYPGSREKIAVYVRTRGSGYLLTDRGATMAMLGRYLSSDTGEEERWEPVVRKLCDGLGIRMQGREWTVRARKTEDVGRAALLLAQGLLRASIMAPVFKITRDSRRGNG